MAASRAGSGLAGGGEFKKKVRNKRDKRTKLLLVTSEFFLDYGEVQLGSYPEAEFFV
jgi:hypothetical protein